MKNTSDIVGTSVFLFQTEIAFIIAIFTTTQRLVVSARDHISQKQYWSACLCVLLLVAYVGLTAGVVWAVMPWLKTFFSGETCHFTILGHAVKGFATLGYR